MASVASRSGRSVGTISSQRFSMKLKLKPIGPRYVSAAATGVLEPDRYAMKARRYRRRPTR
jgi:hypothetical protein